MQGPRISMIAAIGKNRELGKDNKLLWDIKDDMRRFRTLTTGHTLIMGRKTYHSIGRALPNRTNIVLSHDKKFRPDDCLVVNTSQEAIRLAQEKESEEVFIIGGGMVYKLFLPYATRLYLTIVQDSFEADTFFPDYSEFTKILYEEEKSNDRYSYTFLELERGNK